MAKIINVPHDIERSAPDGRVTRRSLDTTSSKNQSLPRRMQAVVDDAYKQSNVFAQYPTISSKEQLDQLLAQLIIRFDTRPEYYTKKDYQLLISVLCGALDYIGKQESEDPEEEHEKCLSAIFPPEGEYKVVNDNTLFIPSFAGDVRTRTLKLHSALNVENKHNIIIFK